MSGKVIRSTSRSSAECSDIVLRETTTARLVFRPELVENPRDSAAAVHGTFLYQRKGRNDAWEDTTTISLSGLKKGEGYRLELHAGEVLSLFQDLAGLYNLYAKDGIPRGVTELVRVDSLVASLASLPPENVAAYLSANRSIGEDLLSTLLTWAVNLDDPASFVSRLISLGPAELRNLNAAVGLQSLKQALKKLRANANNDAEEFWQQTLTAHSFVLEQVLSWPITIVKGKAYVGGKSVLDTGGGIVDFLVRNCLTNNAALVEIKAPATKLLDRPYRQHVYNVSEELTGAVMQILNYRFSLQRDFRSLRDGLGGGLEAFEPRCVVIIGSTEEIRGDANKTRAFELFRSLMGSVVLITFDELFEKTERLVSMLETAM